MNNINIKTVIVFRHNGTPGSQQLVIAFVKLDNGSGLKVAWSSWWLTWNKDTKYTLSSRFKAFGSTPFRYGNFQLVDDALEWLSRNAHGYLTPPDEDDEDDD